MIYLRNWWFSTCRKGISGIVPPIKHIKPIIYSDVAGRCYGTHFKPGSFMCFKAWRKPGKPVNILETELWEFNDAWWMMDLYYTQQSEQPSALTHWCHVFSWRKSRFRLGTPIVLVQKILKVAHHLWVHRGPNFWPIMIELNEPSLSKLLQ